MVGQVITLPQDEQLVARLRRKLVEYHGRLELDERGHARSLGSVYKTLVLERLLKDGRVCVDELKLEVERLLGDLDYRRFRNACLVIEDYATTGGKLTIGGTGLPCLA